MRACFAERDGEGALVVYRDRSLVLHGGGSAAHGLLGALPPRPPGRGRPVTLPTDTLAAVLTADPERARRLDQAETLAELGVPEDEAAQIVAVLRGCGHRSQVSAVVHDRWGGPHRPVRHLTVLDGAPGRYRLTRSLSLIHI